MRASYLHFAVKNAESSFDVFTNEPQSLCRDVGILFSCTSMSHLVWHINYDGSAPFSLRFSIIHSPNYLERENFRADAVSRSGKIISIARFIYPPKEDFTIQCNDEEVYNGTHSGYWLANCIARSRKKSLVQLI